MKDKGDAYRIWLGIPRSEQPPHHYRLLGIQLYESDPNVIDHAASRQCLQLKSVQTGPQSRLSQQLLNEVSSARVCLLDPQKKAAYDATLAAKLGTPAVVSVAGSRSGNSSLKKKPASRTFFEIIKIVLGSLAGLFLAVLVLYYFAGIDLIPRKKPKRSVAKIEAKNSAPAHSEVDHEEASPRRVAASAPASQEPQNTANSTKDVKQTGSSKKDSQTTKTFAIDEPPENESQDDNTVADEVIPKMVANPSQAVGAAVKGSATDPLAAELVASMEAMPEPFVTGRWQSDGRELVTEGAFGPAAQVCLFGDPKWEEYNLKVEVSADQPNMMYGVAFLAGDEDKWVLEFACLDHPRHLDLLAWVEGEFRWYHPSRRWKGQLLHGEMGKWYAAEVQVRGPKVTILVDGKYIDQSEHPKLLKGRIGAASLGVGRARWRNFEVTSPESVILWRGLPELPDKITPPVLDRGARTPDVNRKDTESQKKETAILAKMNRELSAYRLELLAARKLMFKAFDDAETKVQSSKSLAVGEKNPILARLAEERKAFAAAGYLPFSTPMRPAWPGYLSKRRRAEETLRTAFDKQIAATFKAKESESGSLLQKQRDRCFAPTIVARWGTAGYTLHSDFTAHHDRWGTGIWEIKTDVIVINWDSPNPKSSIDTCQLNIMGSGFEGQNLRGDKFTGQWLPPTIDQQPAGSEETAWKKADTRFVQYRRSIGQVWAEFGKGSGGPAKTWLEVGRTSEYVELQEDGKDRYVRLYKDRAEWSEGTPVAERRLLAESKGAWEDEGSTEPVPENAIRKSSAGRTVQGDIPSIDGVWTAKWDGKRILISQKGGKFVLVCEFQDAKGGGAVRWEGEGSISKEGTLEMVINAFLVAKSEVRVLNRTGQLSPDGKTITGLTASSTGERGDYTWTFVGSR